MAEIEDVKSETEVVAEDSDGRRWELDYGGYHHDAGQHGQITVKLVEVIEEDE